MKTQGLEVWRSRSHVWKPRQHWGNAQKTPTDKGWVFGKWWWDGTPRQTYVTQRLTTAANSCGKVRNPALDADILPVQPGRDHEPNTSDTAPVRFPFAELNPRPDRVPGSHNLTDVPGSCLVARKSYSTIGLRLCAQGSK